MSESVAVRVPQLNVNDDQVRIISWLVASGDKVEKMQSLVVLETSKTTSEIEAPEAGVVHFTLRPDDEVAVGEVLCRIAAARESEDSPRFAGGDSEPPDKPAAVPSPPLAGGDSATEEPPPTRFSAQARKRMEALGLAPEVFAGKGLVREQDILRLSPGLPSPAVSEGETPAPTAPAPRVKAAEGVPVRFEPLSRQKILEGKFLASSYFHALSSSVTVSCPTTGLRRAVARQPQIRGNATALILFEAARLLRRFPIFNAFCQDGQVGYYERVNMGLAMDAGRGLKVVVVHDADKKSCPAIAAEVGELISQYLEERLPVEALSGGTFTLTDLSGEGVHSFWPLINQGQSAILGIGGELSAAGSNQGAFNLMLTFDHRLAEGRAAAQFLNALRDRLSSHEAALAEVRADGPAELHCRQCQRSAEQIKDLDGCLLPCAYPRGHLCNFCLTGY